MILNHAMVANELISTHVTASYSDEQVASRNLGCDLFGSEQVFSLGDPLNW